MAAYSRSTAPVIGRQQDIDLIVSNDTGAAGLVADEDVAIVPRVDLPDLFESAGGRRTGADRCVVWAGFPTGVAVRIYRPHPAQGAIIWLHGGGFVMGDLDTEHPGAARLTDGSSAVVISVGYRRAPEHRFPAALDDAYAVLTWTAEHAAELGIDPGRIASEVTVPARGSRSRWRGGRVTSRGRRSASSCSTSPRWMTGRRRGRNGTSPIRPGCIATGSPRCRGTTWAPRAYLDLGVRLVDVAGRAAELYEKYGPAGAPGLPGLDPPERDPEGRDRDR